MSLLNVVKKDTALDRFSEIQINRLPFIFRIMINMVMRMGKCLGLRETQI